MDTSSSIHAQHMHTPDESSPILSEQGQQSLEDAKGKGHYKLKKYKEKNRKSRHETRTKETSCPPRGEDLEKTSFIRHIFSWRVAIYFLLQSAFIMMCLPLTTMSMTFVCIEDNMKKEMEEEQRLKNHSIEELEKSYSENGSGVFTSLQNGNSSWDGKTVFTPDLDWDQNIKGLVLSGVMITSPLSPIIINKIRRHTGNKWAMILAGSLSAALTIITPAAARASPYLQLCLRIIHGFTLAAQIPISGETLAWWTPDSEKLTASVIVYAGYNMSALISNLISGFLCSIPVDNGWPFIFYVYGPAILLWLLLWNFVYSRKPETHRFLSEREKKYIISSRVGMPSEEELKTMPKVEVPYRTILTSVPVLAVYVVNLCHIYCLSLNIVYLPLYLNLVLNFTAKETGVVFAVLSVLRLIGGFLWTIIGNLFVSYNVLTKEKSRKVCICLGMFGAASFAALISFFDKDQRWLALTFLATGIILQSVGTSSMPSLPQDMAPRYAAYIQTIQSSTGQVGGATAPLVASALTPNNTYSEWRMVWILVCVIYTFAATVFLLAGQARLQPWATGKMLMITTGSRESEEFQAAEMKDECADIDIQSVGVEVPEEDKIAHDEKSKVDQEVEEDDDNGVELNGLLQK